MLCGGSPSVAHIPLFLELFHASLHLAASCIPISAELLLCRRGTAPQGNLAVSLHMDRTGPKLDDASTAQLTPLATPLLA